MTATSNARADSSIDQPRTSPLSTRILLIAGAAAGPLFALLATGQVLLRDGFDLRRHPLSLLSTGGLGFVQIGNFMLAGLGVLCLAIAVRRTITDGVGRRLLAPLIAVFGLGLIASGVFVMDPENGFPIGTPEGLAQAMSWHGVAHVVAATVAFTGLAAACIVLTVRMVRRRAGWAAVLNAGAALVLLAPVNPAWATIQLAATALVAFAWTTALALRLLRSSSAR
ncbi:MAG TPA: DUF998 domain-containing protein [Propionibacteriaceae bacterium]|nr:DUF998 domain-containing protein [Propionibacteriaceae bacterium]